MPTEYKGFQFRSRLEARWAVAFDDIGTSFEYEPDGFKFSDGTMYLPDFYLPSLNYWAEVKYSEFSVVEFKKCLMLADNTGVPCILLSGSPNETAYFIYANMYLSEAWNNYQNKVGFVRAPEIFGVSAEQWQRAVYTARAARFGVYD